MGAADQVLDARTLNRASLGRQLLLERSKVSTLDAVRHLCGMQAREPLEPYVGLRSRLVAFQPSDLGELLRNRDAVRTLLMRRTLHLVPAEDCRTLRPLFQPMLVQRNVRRAAATAARCRPRRTRRRRDAAVRRGAPAAQRRRAGGAGPVAGRRGARPRGCAEHVGAAGAGASARGVGARNGTGAQHDHRGLARAGAARHGAWRRRVGAALSARVRSGGERGRPRLVGAVRPAAALERLRPQLWTFRDERGRVLLDVPDGPLPDPEVPASVRFLPAFDNAVLGYDDRGRIIDSQHRGLSVQGARFVLVDGRVSATWTTVVTSDGATVRIEPLRPLGDDESAEVVEEGERLATFLSDGTPGRVDLRMHMEDRTGRTTAGSRSSRAASARSRPASWPRTAIRGTSS